ncbi:hypothetical protein DL96DRAFT_241356 [Flagelloscypha sp. PMI_526]|nr:hypothetical protein DL96DRAFT_241356 [Flagelloscypha sp. PMI_526]
MATSYLITGSSRGLGLGLANLLALKPKSEVSHIFATARKPSAALTKLVDANRGRVHFVELEVTDADSIRNAAKRVEDILVEHNGVLDVLVNNAGILNLTPDGVETMSDLSETLNINVVGMHLVTAGFLPLLRKGTGKKIVNVSSTMGSLAYSHALKHQRAPAYKISKAAANMLTLQYAHDLEKDGFSVVCLSPGWVKTDMGSEQADLTVDQSVNAVFEIISHVDSGSNGKFFNIRVPGWEDRYPGGEPAW